MSKKLKQEYWAALSSGDVLSLFSNEMVQELCRATIDEETATKLLKHVTQTVVQKCSGDIQNDSNIFMTVKHLLNLVVVPTCNPDVPTLSCIYYISKYFIGKSKLDMALDLKPFLGNYKEEISEDVLKTYYGFFYDLNSYLKQNVESLTLDFALKIRHESLEILSLCGVKYLHIILGEADVFVNSKKAHSNQLKCLQFILRIIRLAKDISKRYVINVNCERICICYVQLLTNLVINIINSGHYDLLSEVLNVIDYVNVIQTSNEKCNKLILFFIKTTRQLLISNLCCDTVNQLVIEFQNLIGTDSKSLLLSVVYRLANVCFVVHGYWLSSRTSSLSMEEFLATTELSLCLSSFLKRNIHFENTQIEPTSLAFLSFKVVVTFISLGINILLHVKCQGEGDCYSDEFHSVYDQLIIIQKQCVELLSILKKYEGNHWKDPWKILANRCTKLASVLEYVKCYEYASNVYLLTCSAMVELETLFENQEALCSEDCIYKAFKGASQCLIKQNKFEVALIYISIAALFLPSERVGLQKLWRLGKKNAVSSQDYSLQNLSVIKVLQSKAFEVFPRLALIILERLVSASSCLLFWELEAYMVDRSSMKESICAVAKELICSTSYTLTYCEAVQLALSGLWWMYDVIEHDFSVLYDKGIQILAELENKTTCNRKPCIFLLMGNMHYYCFFAKMTALRKNLLEEVISMQEKFPSNIDAKVMIGIVDPTEAEMKNNLFTMYADLNVDKEEELISILVKALDAWSKVSILVPEDQSCLDKLCLLKNLETSAQAFALYGYHTYSLRTWKLYYEQCKTINNFDGMLYALSQLLKHAGGNSKCNLWKEADNIALAVESEEVDTNRKEILFHYFLTKSKNCLMNKECDLGWQYLQKLTESSIRNTFGAQLIFVQKNVLLSRYYLQSHGFSVAPKEFEDGSCFAYVMRALRILKSLYVLNKSETGSNGNCTISDNFALHVVMMEVADWVGELWLGVKLYRDGYAHLKYHICVAQILGLSSRCSKFLCKLTQLDLLRCEVENADAKLLGLEAMLCLSDVSLLSLNRKEMHDIDEHLKVQYDDLAVEDEGIVHFLDVAVPERPKFTGSPELRKLVFKMPSFALHKENCTCLFCSSVFLHCVLLEITYIKAQLHIFNAEYDLAESFLKGGVKLSERLQIMQKKIINNLNGEIYEKNEDFSSLCESSFLSMAKIFLSYAEHLFLHSRFDEMEKMIEQARCRLLLPQDIPFSLEIIDKMQTLYSYSDCNDRPLRVDDQGPKSPLENFENEDRLCTPVMKTPMEAKAFPVKVPILKRNEDHIHLPRIISPSLVVDLDSEFENADNLVDERMKTTSRLQCKPKISRSIVFDDSNDDINVFELPSSEIYNKENTTFKCVNVNETIVINSASSEDEVSVFKEIDVLANKLENVALRSKSSNSKAKNKSKSIKVDVISSESIAQPPQKGRRVVSSKVTQNVISEVITAVENMEIGTSSRIKSNISCAKSEVNKRAKCSVTDKSCKTRSRNKDSEHAPQICKGVLAQDLNIKFVLKSSDPPVAHTPQQRVKEIEETCVLQSTTKKSTRSKPLRKRNPFILD